MAGIYEYCISYFFLFCFVLNFLGGRVICEFIPLSIRYYFYRIKNFNRNIDTAATATEKKKFSFFYENRRKSTILAYVTAFKLFISLIKKLVPSEIRSHFSFLHYVKRLM